jgi:hypothetical protein
MQSETQEIIISSLPLDEPKIVTWLLLTANFTTEVLHAVNKASFIWEGAKARKQRWNTRTQKLVSWIQKQII